MLLLISGAAPAHAQSNTWGAANIGNPVLPGSMQQAGAQTTLSGAGATTIDATRDQLYFVYRTLSGDVDVIARVASLAHADRWSLGGVMVRASLQAGAASATMAVAGTRGRAFMSRPAHGARREYIYAGDGQAPVWLKLERRGSTITAFWSNDGTTWTLAATQTIALPQTIHVGLAVTSNVADQHATGAFEAVTIVEAGTPPPTPPTVALTAPGDGEAFTAPASIGLAADALDDDGISQVEFFADSTLIGVDTTSPFETTWSSVPAGSYRLTAVARDVRGATATSAPRTITVQEPADTTPPTVSISAPADGHVAAGPVAIAAAASDDAAVAAVTFRVNGAVVATDATAPYEATWDPSGAAPGSHSLTAEAVDTAGNSTMSAAITVIVPTPNAPPTVALTAPADGSSHEAPVTLTLAADAADADGSVTQVEFYADGVLIGTDSSAPYRVDWANVPAGSYALTAIARDDDGAAATSPARTITVRPDVPLPAGWSETGVGNPALPGRAGESEGVFTIDGAGRNIEGPSDQFYFAYQQVSGDVDVVARAVTLENTHAWAKAGVMIRASLAPNSPHASMFVTAGNGSAYQRRLQAGVPSIHTAGGPNGAPLWVKLERRGTAVTAFHSADGTSWTMIGSDSFTLPDPFYVGLAVTSRDEAQLATATFDGVAVTPVVRPPQPPAVALTAPADGATFTAPATIAVTATASDDDDGIAQVEFFAGSTLLDVDTTEPYRFDWTNVPVGTYRLTAVARDSSGAVTTSATHTVTVGPANGPPVVALTAPADGETFMAPATVTLAADAADADGQVTQVEFYAGSVLLGTDATSPYTFTWTNAPQGTHALTAVARDDDGAVATSAARTIVISADGTAPSVAIASPQDGAEVEGAVTISATASDNVGVASVTFRVNGVEIGSPVTAAPYSIVWETSGLQPGSYVLTADAVDEAGNRTTSAGVTVTVAQDEPLPTRAVFVASSNHDTAVERYVLEIFTEGADPDTATPMQVQDLGRPAVSNGECAADIAATIVGLPNGRYIATVTAVGPGGSARSAPSAPFTR